MDGVDDGLVVLGGENGFVGWGIGFHPDVGISFYSILSDPFQDRLAAAHEQAGTAFLLQLFHLIQEQIRPRNLLLRGVFHFQPTARLDDVTSIGKKSIGVHQGLGKSGVFLCQNEGMRIHRINEELAFRPVLHFRAAAHQIKFPNLHSECEDKK